MGFQENPQVTISATVAASSLAARFFVKQGSSSGAAAIAGAGEKILGVTLGVTNSAGESILIARGGRVLLTVDGSAGEISIGDRLIADASGRGVKSTTDKAEYGASADAGSTSAGDVIPVYVELGTIAN